MVPEENGASLKGEALLRTMWSLFKSEKKEDRKVLSVLGVHLIYLFLNLFAHIMTTSQQL